MATCSTPVTKGAHRACGQLSHLRPAPGYADFRTAIGGLCQCSSATHRGGGVVCIAGTWHVGASTPITAGAQVRLRR